MNAKPKVIKMCGTWLWTCNHSGPVGDEFRPGEWRDPWTAALATARKHAAAFHNADPGEQMGEVG